MAVSGAQRGISGLGFGSVCGCSGVWCPMAGIQKCRNAARLAAQTQVVAVETELLDES